METSIRYNGDSKAIRFHAKQKLPLSASTFLQARGELDTKSGAPSHLSTLIRHFRQDISANIGAGLQLDKNEKLRFFLRAKKTFPVTKDGLLRFNVKGQCDVDKDFRQRKLTGGAEFTWGIPKFQKNQDIKLKVGFEVFDQVPYIQIKENNWAFKVDSYGRWNIKYEL